MNKVILISLLLVLSLTVFAEDLKPLADFRVHTIVTSGPKFYEGDKIRAVLTYGELGAPYIFMETIKVKEGYPDLSMVLWCEKIDVTEKIDKTGHICEGPEGVWSCSLENLRWEGSALKYEIITSKVTYECSTNVTSTSDHTLSTKCSKLK
jgi:hypothetical protein